MLALPGLFAAVWLPRVLPAKVETTKRRREPRC